jgi:predicted alpha/beta superfamily hydrolase
MRTRLAFLALLLASLAPLRAGELRTDEIASKAVGKTLKVNVLLPDDYKAGERRYPVVYLLHGARSSGSSPS